MTVIRMHAAATQFDHAFPQAAQAGATPEILAAAEDEEGWILGVEVAKA